MSTYVLAYTGGSMAESEEEQKAVMAAWGAWIGGLGDALTDAGNPFGPSTHRRRRRQRQRGRTPPA